MSETEASKDSMVSASYKLSHSTSYSRLPLIIILQDYGDTLWESSPPVDKAITETTNPPFLSTPLEVRHMIYNLVLVGEHEIVPYPASWEWDAASKPHPSPALLAVNRQISDEARRILYGKNQWRLPASAHRSHRPMFDDYPWLFRNVTVFFDGRDLPESEKTQLALSVHADPPVSQFIADKPAATARHIHSSYLVNIAEEWRAKASILRAMTGAERLTINVETLLCPSGCCRMKVMKGTFCDSFLKTMRFDITGKHRESWVRSRWPNGVPEIRFEGLKSDEERSLIHDTYSFPRVEEGYEHAEPGSEGGYEHAEPGSEDE